MEQGLTANIHRQQREIGWCDPADPPRLAERFRANPIQLLTSLGAQPGDGLIVDLLGNSLLVTGPKFFDREFLAGDVAGVFQVDLDRFPQVREDRNRRTSAGRLA